MKMSQRSQVLYHLQANGRITSWEAITRFRVTRLASIIFDLRNEGYDISCENKTSVDGKKYGEYTLHKKGQMNLF